MSKEFIVFANSKHIIEEFLDRISDRTKEIGKFSKNLITSGNPAKELGASDKYFECAAEIKLFSHFITLLENDPGDYTIDGLRRIFRRAILKHSQIVGKTTSPTYNLMEQHIAQAYVNFVEGGKLEKVLSASQKRDDNLKTLLQKVK